MFLASKIELLQTAPANHNTLQNMKTVLAKGGKMSVSHTWDKKCSCISSSYEGRDADLQPKRKPMAQLGRTC